MSFSIAIVNPDKCKPNKCALECKKICPVVRMGKQCIVVDKTSKIANISESMCIGCGLCEKKCPYGAINIINLPQELKENLIHKYGENGFRLYKLPIPKKENIVAILGDNGCGKSSILKILARKMIPNNITNVNTSIVLQKYFEELVKPLTNSKLLSFKPQHIDKIPDIIKGNVMDYFNKLNIDLEKYKQVYDLLGIYQIIDKNVEYLSGGELQRFANFICITQDSKIYMFDESSSYLDIKQRINLAKAIRNIDSSDKYIFVVDHDLAVIDYMCDYIYLLYGKPSNYGIVSNMMTVSHGINNFLEGFISSENMRFRNSALSFKINREDTLIEKKEDKSYKYPKMIKTYDNFKLTIEEGSFNNNEINILLGENGVGKTTFIKLLTGKLKPDDGVTIPELMVSYKPQILSPKFEGTVNDLLNLRIKNAITNSRFNLEVVKPLDIEDLMDKKVKELSGGELQVISLIVCLGTPADIYLIDEISNFLDCSKRVTVAKIIRRFIMNNQKSCFVVEHDLLLILYLADKVMLFDGVPGKECVVDQPKSVYNGLNSFLKNINVTMRKDINTGRPRFNKLDSVKDHEQKANGQYIFLD